MLIIQVQRLKVYKEFFESYLEKTVSCDFIFAHPDFSNIMECKKKVENMIPPNLDDVVKRKQVEEYTKIMGMLGSLAQEFALYIKTLHEEPATVKPWKKRSFKKSSLNNRSLKEESPPEEDSERFEIGGQKYEVDDLAPDILNAMRKQQEVDILSGMTFPKPQQNKISAEDLYVSSVKVKVRWETEFHSYNVILFKQCLVFSKVRNRSLKISRVIKLKQLWISEYKESDGFFHVPTEKEDNALLASWFESELDDEFVNRVIFSFPDKDTRVYWHSLLQRHITKARSKILTKSGVIKVYFKKSDSKLTVPGDNLWQGMSCRELQIDTSETVVKVIEEAVDSCQMLENQYKLTFIMLQNCTVMCEVQLIWMEMPLIIQTEMKSILPDPKNVQLIYMLQEDSGSSSPVPTNNKLNNFVTFFRSRHSPAAALASSLSSQATNLAPVQHHSNIMFGAPLSDFMTDPDIIPTPLLDLMVYLYNHCYNCEGIFRIPGALIIQREFESRLESGERLDWSVEELQDKFYMPNVASSLFKYYLRSLPGGLIPSTMFPDLESWRADMEKTEDINDAKTNMLQLISSIPSCNQTLLKYTIHTFKRISDFSSVNLMEVSVLATCVGPSLATWPEDSNALSILADQYRRQTPAVVVEFLLRHVTELLGGTPEDLQLGDKVVEEDVKSRRSRMNEGVSSDEEDNGLDSLWDMMRGAKLGDSFDTSSDSRGSGNTKFSVPDPTIGSRKFSRETLC